LSEEILLFDLGFYESLVNEKQSINIYLFIIGAHYSTDTHVYSGLKMNKRYNG
jgi:hypothetical protein